MNLKRYIIELGMGADLHGQNVTKAAQKAVKDAVSRSCLCGLVDIFGFNDPDQMYIKLSVAVPFPSQVDKRVILASVPFGSVEIEVKEGGMLTDGLDLPLVAEGDKIVIAVVSLTVFVDFDALDPKLFTA